MENLNMLTDDMLVARYSEGDNKAFDELLARYQSKLFNYIFFIVRSQELAEDIFQETFVKAITTIQQGRYTPSGKFGSWLTRIAHNMIVDSYRQERNENTISNDEVEVDLFNDADLCDDNIETQMVNEQTLTDVRRLMDALPSNQREVVYMRYYQDLSFKEIAEITGVSINTALGRMRYAIMGMRRLAEEKHIVLEVY
ncbi:MAG: sigma-70 family RNA polymerase sigma factor [Bacteroidaceae bacterium]|jgi:RNA polymerase sigma-70 factor (ECF subfamily)|nr:sigma-70 family RNA polymerase sigma factor [Bacteroidaceae bacterium]MBQ2142132.1 sigma-70 family RNA polymerase sigma factor [Alistipes sp.]